MTLFPRRPLFWLAAPAILCSVFLSSFAQMQPYSASKRRLVERSAPAYPNLARNLALAGIVRMEAVVSPDGSVKTVAVKGGHPVLAQAAVNAVRKWRWEPISHESREPVEVTFSPE